MKLRRLLAPAIIITENSDGGKPRIGERRKAHPNAHKVPPSTVVAIEDENVPSPITPRHATEITVRWCDEKGRMRRGWIARTTPMDERINGARCPTFIAKNTDERLHAWDVLRAAIVFEPKWDAVRWLLQFGATRLPHVHAVIREFGGRVPHSDDPDVAIARAIQLITLRKVTMKRIKKARKEQTTEVTRPTKNASKKKATKAQTPRKVGRPRKLDAHGIPRRGRTAEESAKGIAITTGTRLLAVTKVKWAPKYAATFKKMSAGKKVGVRELESAREYISAVIIAKRDKAPKLAAELTTCNRLMGRTIGKVQASK